MPFDLFTARFNMKFSYMSEIKKETYSQESINSQLAHIMSSIIIRQKGVQS